MLSPALNALTESIDGAPMGERLAWRAAQHAEHLSQAIPGRDTVAACLGDVDTAKIIHHLNHRLDLDACLGNDSGAFAGWLHRHFTFRTPRSQFAACLGAMGYGVPGAIGVQLARPQSQTIALIGLSVGRDVTGCLYRLFDGCRSVV